MDSTTTGARGVGLSARQFFARKIQGARMTDAHQATGVAYSTIHSISRGAGWQRDSIAALVRWSINNPAALAEGVFISADAEILDDSASDVPSDNNAATGTEG